MRQSKLYLQAECQQRFRAFKLLGFITEMPLLPLKQPPIVFSRCTIFFLTCCIHTDEPKLMFNMKRKLEYCKYKQERIQNAFCVETTVGSHITSSINKLQFRVAHAAKGHIWLLKLRILGTDDYKYIAERLEGWGKQGYSAKNRKS